MLRNSCSYYTITDPTNNVSKNTIDLVITSPLTNVYNVSVIDCALSDHIIIGLQTDFVKVVPRNVTVQTRNYRKISIKNFQ